MVKEEDWKALWMFLFLHFHIFPVEICVSLECSIYPSTCKAQGYMQEEEKGHAFSFPPAHPAVGCSIAFIMCSYK